MDKKITDYIKQSAQNFFKEWPFEFKIDIATDEDFVLVKIDCPKNEIFLRPTLDPMLAIQHLLRLIVRKEFPDQVIKLSVDIGGFKQKREEVVKRIAQEAIDKALNSNQEVPLLPMSSFERRIVHTCVAENGKVTSESLGLGRDRYVVVKPQNNV